MAIYKAFWTNGVTRYPMKFEYKYDKGPVLKLKMHVAYWTVYDLIEVTTNFKTQEITYTLGKILRTEGELLVTNFKGDPNEPKEEDPSSVVRSGDPDLDVVLRDGDGLGGSGGEE